MPTAIDNILSTLHKQGTEATVLSDEDSPCVVHDWLSTGTLVLDAVMGGGLPTGRVVELYGATSSGKSLIAEQACAACQDDDGIAVYIDSEAAVSLPLIEALGVNTDELVYLAPDTVEEVFAAMEAVVDSKPADTPMLIVWDSIAATSSRSEMEGDTGDVGYLTHARVISQGLRKLTRKIARQKVSVLMINQLKHKIGVVFGDSDATFGGLSVGFHSSIRVRLSSGTRLKDSKKRIMGIRTTAVVKKNKVAPPFRQAALPIYFGHGIDDAEAALLFLKGSRYVKSSGGWYDVDLLAGVQRVRSAGWEDLYYDNLEDIEDMVFDYVSEGDLI